MRLLILISSLFFASLSQAGIAPFHIKMDLGNKYITVAESDIRFQPSGDHQQIITQTKMKGFYAFIKKDKIIESTLLVEAKNRYLPYQYDYKKTGSSDNETLHYNWDYANKKVYQTQNGKKQTVALHDNAYDTNSIILGFATWLKDTIDNHKKMGGSKKFYYHDKHGATLKEYKMGESEMLDLPYGRVRAIKFYPINESKNEKKLNIWIAPEKGYIPVKYEQIKNGSVKVKLELRKIY